MLIQAEQEVREMRERMRGGEGTVEIAHLLPNDEKPGKCRMVARVTLPVGASIGQHDHQGEAEIYHILSGQALADDSGKLVTMQPGDTLLTHNAAHSIANAGDQPLVFIAIVILD